MLLLYAHQRLISVNEVMISSVERQTSMHEAPMMLVYETNLFHDLLAFYL